jgi:hypothetical protein
VKADFVVIFIFGGYSHIAPNPRAITIFVGETGQ